jgi:hypothetical protein
MQTHVSSTLPASKANFEGRQKANKNRDSLHNACVPINH